MREAPEKPLRNPPADERQWAWDTAGGINKHMLV